MGFVSKSNAQDRMLEGLNAPIEALSSMLGPDGANTTICGEEKASFDDGYQFAIRIRLKDPIAQEAWSRAIDAARTTHNEVGDGTTHTLLLALYLILGGNNESIKKDISGVDSAKTIEADVTALLKELRTLKQTDVTLRRCKEIAALAMHGDARADLIGSLAYDMGKHGQLVMKLAQNNELSYKINNGYAFNGSIVDKRLLSATDRLELDSPLVCFVADELKNYDDFSHVVREYLKYHETEKKMELRPLVVVTNRNAVSHDALAHFMNPMHQKLGRLPIYLCDGLNVTDGNSHADLDKLFVAKPVSKLLGMNIRDFGPNNLGEAASAVISADKVILEYVWPSFVDECVRNLEAMLDLPDANKQAIKDRIANVDGKIGVLYVNAKTESELSSIYEVIDDGYKAATNAMRNGYYAGGGGAVAMACRVLNDDSEVKKIMGGLYNSLYREDGVFETLPAKAKAASLYNCAYNLSTKQLEHIDTTTIIDSAFAIEKSIENALSVALPLIKTEFYYEHD